MHTRLPWIYGPRTPRPILPRVWAPAHRRPIEVVILAPYRRLAVHWTGGRHVLHFPAACPTCPVHPDVVEHGYAAALVRYARPGQAEVSEWTHGVAQLTERPLLHCAYRGTDPWIYTLSRNGGPASMVTVERRPCDRHVWLQGISFDPSQTLERLYGCRWKDAEGRVTGLHVDPRSKGGAS